MSFGSPVLHCLQDHGVICTGKTNKKTKYSPEKSVVKLEIGDELKLTESALVAHFKAFFAEAEKETNSSLSSRKPGLRFNQPATHRIADHFRRRMNLEFLHHPKPMALCGLVADTQAGR